MAENDPILSIAPQQFSLDVMLEKYAKGDEKDLHDVRARVARALAQVEAPDQREAWAARFLDALQGGFVPAGRINSAAGTELTATLVLAPIGVETLATQFWAYQSEVAYGAAAPYALVIVGLAAIPGALLGLWFDRGRETSRPAA